MIFKGRIDAFWYVLPLALLALAGWLQTQTSVWQVLLPLAAPIVLSTALLVRNKVVITAQGTMKIYLGLFTKTIVLNDVTGMATTNSLWSSWSSSKQRILVNYNKYNAVMIGVKNEAEFFSFIEANYPTIHIKKDR